MPITQNLQVGSFDQLALVRLPPGGEGIFIDVKLVAVLGVGVVRKGIDARRGNGLGVALRQLGVGDAASHRLRGGGDGLLILRVRGGATSVEFRLRPTTVDKF